MDQGIFALIFLGLIGAILIGLIVLNSRKPPAPDENKWLYYERCSILFIYFGFVRYGVSTPGHIGISDNGILIRLLITRTISYAEIRSISIYQGIIKHLRIAYGMPGQAVRIYSKQPEYLLSVIQKQMDLHTTD